MQQNLKSSPPAVVTVTDAAKQQIEKLVLAAPEGKPIEGIRLGVKARGCSGLMYTMDYTDNIAPHEDVIMCGNTKLVIDALAVMHILGTEIDFQSDNVHDGFVFNNPNEAGRCGCGESFHTQAST